MTDINSGLRISEPDGGIKYGTDALLLSHFMLPHAGRKGFELGTGSGVISLLYLSKNSSSTVVAAEIQQEYAEAAEANAVANGLDSRMKVIHADIRDHRRLYPSGSFDFVFANPPYFVAGSGKGNANKRKDTAFHEGDTEICDFLGAAAWLLKNGGKFYAVYRPERMATLMNGMIERMIQPKRLKLVFPDASSKPSLILIEGRKEGAEGLIIEPNLYIYKGVPHTEYSDGMKEIFETFN